jgi:DNA-binding transcriptional LysR family regulator
MIRKMPLGFQPEICSVFAQLRSQCPHRGDLLLTEVETILGTCLSGAGIAQIKALGIQELLDSGQLIDLFPDWPDERFPLYALYPSRHLPAAKVRAFIDFVVAVVGPRVGRTPSAQVSGAPASRSPSQKRSRCAR